MTEPRQRSIRFLPGLVAALLLCFASTSTAQSVRTFVSTAGTDNATCSRSAPCRTFAAAMMAVNAGGEVVPLDSGGYSPFVITKSVAIIVPADIHAAVTPTTGSGVLIQAGPTDTVTIRGLYINNLADSASFGVRFEGGKALHVERCEMVGFNTGVIVDRDIDGESVEVYVNDSTFRDGSNGIYLEEDGIGSILYAAINRCRIENHLSSGLTVREGVRATAYGVTSVRNFIGFTVAETFGGLSELTLQHCVSLGNDWGVYVYGGGATLRMSSSAVNHNDIGVQIFNNVDGAAQGFSLGNNVVSENGTNVSGSLVIIPAK